MLQSLIDHFTTGQMSDFIEYNRKWILLKEPKIEQNMGFVETIHDPFGARAELEGFIAIKDLEITEKLKFLSQHDTQLQIMKMIPIPSYAKINLEKMPQYWPSQLLLFVANSNIIGKNLPNYDEVTDLHGCKNFSMTNRIVPLHIRGVVDDSLAIRACEYMRLVEILSISLHELFGHGSKAFVFEADFESLSLAQKLELK